MIAATNDQAKIPTLSQRPHQVPAETRGSREDWIGCGIRGFGRLVIALSFWIVNRSMSNKPFQNSERVLFLEEHDQQPVKSNGYAHDD